jgi:phage terminase large subunit-like protein
MCAFTVDFDRKDMGYSPDRVDALVWALTELMIDGGERRLFLGCGRRPGV